MGGKKLEHRISLLFGDYRIDFVTQAFFVPHFFKETSREHDFLG